VKANHICQQMQDRMAKITTPGPEPTPSDVIQSIDSRATITADSLDRLRSLPMPAGDELKLRAIYTDVATVLRDYTLTSGAVRIGLRSNAMAAATKGDEDAAKANAASAAYGLTACAALPGPVAPTAPGLS
jgi:hypothetical protein